MNFAMQNALGEYWLTIDSGMDGFIAGKGIGNILKDCNKITKKIFVLCFMPVGFLLSRH